MHLFFLLPQQFAGTCRDGSPPRPETSPRESDNSPERTPLAAQSSELAWATSLPPSAEPGPRAPVVTLPQPGSPEPMPLPPPHESPGSAAGQWRAFQDPAGKRGWRSRGERAEWFLEGDPAWKKYSDEEGRAWWWREKDELWFYEVLVADRELPEWMPPNAEVASACCDAPALATPSAAPNADSVATCLTSDVAQSTSADAAGRAEERESTRDEAASADPSAPAAATTSVEALAESLDSNVALFPKRDRFVSSRVFHPASEQAPFAADGYKDPSCASKETDQRRAADKWPSPLPTAIEGT